MTAAGILIESRLAARLRCVEIAVAKVADPDAAVDYARRLILLIERGDEIEKHVDVTADSVEIRQKLTKSCAPAPTPDVHQCTSEDDRPPAPRRPREDVIADGKPTPRGIILAILKELGPAARGDIMRRSGLSRNIVQRRLKELRAEGRVAMTGDKATAVYSVVGAGMDAEPAEKAPRIPPGQPQRRFTERPESDPEKVRALDADHPAVKNGRTMFPGTVTDPAAAKRLLVSGANSMKFGDRIVVGPWKGMPIYGLTLEERATCPSTCHHFRYCYGNGMPFARRLRHGPALEARLIEELTALQAKHPDGFAVRLHTLGDFYSVEYVDLWLDFLSTFPALHVWGYTAWGPETEIGAAIVQMRERWDRFAVRTSVPVERAGHGPLATTVWHKAKGKQPAGYICPADWQQAKVCGNCGLCWHPKMKDVAIAFVAHGNPRAGKERAIDVQTSSAPAAAPATPAPAPATPGGNYATPMRPAPVSQKSAPREAPQPASKPVAQITPSPVAAPVTTHVPAPLAPVDDDKPSIFERDEMRPPPAERPPFSRKAAKPALPRDEEQALIERAVADGKVTRIPDDASEWGVLLALKGAGIAVHKTANGRGWILNGKPATWTRIVSEANTVRISQGKDPIPLKEEGART